MTLIPDFDLLLARAPSAAAVATPRAVDGAALPALRRDHGWPEKWVRDLGAPRGREWLAAFQTAGRVVQRGGIVIFHGTRGGGKTRMAAELAKRGEFPLSEPETVANPLGGTQRRARRHSVYRTAMGFFLEVRDTYGKRSPRTELELVRQMIEPGLLVLDEIQERSESAWENKLLTHILDARYSAERATLLIANLTAVELQASLGPSIMDRIQETGGAIEFDWRSYRQG